MVEMRNAWVDAQRPESAPVERVVSLDEALDFARQKNFLRITLLTDRPSEARRFYLKHGFFESGMIPMRILLRNDP